MSMATYLYWEEQKVKALEEQVKSLEAEIEELRKKLLAFEKGIGFKR